MIKQQIISFCILAISVILAYILSIGPASGFKAWVAKKMGDDTGERMGLLTLDPLEHIDLLGVCLFLPLLVIAFRMSIFVGFTAILILWSLGVSWHRVVVINASYIQGRFRLLKLFLAYFSEVAIYLMQAMFGLVFLAFVEYSAHRFFGVLMSQQLVVVGALIQFVLVFIQLNIMLAVVSFINNGVLLGIVIFHERSEHDYLDYLYYGALILPLVILVFFGAHLQKIFYFLLIQLYTLFVRLFGN